MLLVPTVLAWLLWAAQSGAVAIRDPPTCVVCPPAFNTKVFVSSCESTSGPLVGKTSCLYNDTSTTPPREATCTYNADLSFYTGDFLDCPSKADAGSQVQCDACGTL
ncbi:hypothetical protein SCLCIDRAFT_1211328 [Scleroderma citrinum Foug A]|uniref:Cyanovirin-N domain-containing protein n=1 Tax=Scleroderma citrinum Foug A TaxID=1036808 RepID=A0A0C2ZYQ4_9AGAM|nr:hypothetical protein SCLCIDRAFT_1211328 [Scleroderma citrinum Foug A]